MFGYPLEQTHDILTRVTEHMQWIALFCIYSIQRMAIQKLIKSTLFTYVLIRLDDLTLGDILVQRGQVYMCYIHI